VRIAAPAGVNPRIKNYMKEGLSKKQYIRNRIRPCVKYANHIRNFLGKI